MVRLQIFLLLLFAGWLTAACGVVPRSSHPSNPNPAAVSSTDTAGADSSDSEVAESATDSKPAMAVSSLDDVKASLMQAYRDWEGTPYVLGGASKEGVDCSRFINVIFDEYFAVDLPTNTRSQLNVGDGIRRKAVRTGDLVFFKTGRQDLHVGVAVNQGEFLHASTSNGVMISKLGNSYWRNRFLAARRVL